MALPLLVLPNGFGSGQGTESLDILALKLIFDGGYCG